MHFNRAQTKNIGKASYDTRRCTEQGKSHRSSSHSGKQNGNGNGSNSPGDAAQQFNSRTSKLAGLTGSTRHDRPAETTRRQTKLFFLWRSVPPTTINVPGPISPVKQLPEHPSFRISLSFALERASYSIQQQYPQTADQIVSPC